MFQLGGDMGLFFGNFNIYLCLLLAVPVIAQGQTKNFDESTLEDLLNVPAMVSTKSEIPARSAPGILTVITDAEIKNSGARDLMDVLHLVPGISFGNDSWGTASMGIRGMWGNEGKILLLIDGLEMNEILFSTIQFGNRYPVDTIKKIEIIRGPGSAVYGGFAELAVINIITKKGADLKGCEVSGKVGQMQKSFARRDLTASCGTVVNGTQVSVAVLSGQGVRSDREFTGYNELPLDSDPTNDAQTKTQTYNFSKNRLDPMFINVGISNEKFDFRYIREFYQMTTTTGFGYLQTNRPVFSEFHGHYLGLDYKYKATDHLLITPYFNYKTQKPWQTVDVELASIDSSVTPPVQGSSVVSNFTGERMKTGLNGSYDFGSGSHFLLGAERIEDTGTNENYLSYQAAFSDGSHLKSYATNSAYTQLLTGLGFAQLALGARYDSHSKAGSSFVPRIGFTRAESSWHFKILGASAFRAPTIMNIDSQPEIKPDKTKTFEIEGGHQLSESSYLTVNLFQTTIDDPIIYGIDADGTTRNFNGTRTKTQGLETELKFKDHWGYAILTYSYYKTVGEQPQAYRVTDHPDLMLGFPAHKLTLNSSINTWDKNLKVNPSVVAMSEYYAYNWDAILAQRYFQKLAPGPLANLFLTYDNAFVDHLGLGVGVFNILDTDYRLAQPYQVGYHAPLPTASRELLVRADYEIHF